jgi:uncharacterized protein YndB with AHSA1/START domain
MPREFETRNEFTVHATPEEVWDAIATGPGVDAWFMGRTEIEPGKSVRTAFPGGFTLDSSVTDWDPPHRLAYRGEPAENGEFHAFEYLVEGRGGSTTVVRVVHSGALANWEGEYDAMQEGDAIYAGKLAAYLEHFAGRSGHSFFFQQEKAGDRDAVMAAVRARLGLADGAVEGDRVHVAPEGIEPLDGVVDLAAPHVLGLRTDDALIRFFHAMGTVVVEEHRYGGAAPRDWQGWVEQVAA